MHDEPPTLKSLARAVADMRAKQRAYFKGNRSGAKLAESIDAEQRVDAMVAGILDDRPALPGLEG
jgi:hypothetical protein